jgi:signal transduction histidine kinase
MPAIPTRTALGWAAVAAYPVLMIVAIRSELRDSDGLRALWPVAVMGLPAFGLRRRPGAALPLMIAGSVAVTVVLGSGDVAFGPDLAVAVAVGVVAAGARPRVAIPAAVLALIAHMAANVVWQARHDGRWRHDAVTVAARTAEYYVLILAVALTVGLLVRQRREHAAALRARTADQAIVGERLRIARELHDSVAHHIGVIALQAGAARRVFDTQPDRARQALGAVETAGRETLAELRRMLGALRAAETAGHPTADPAPGLADLDRLAATTTAAGVRVEVRRVGGPGALPPEIDRSAFRIIQESVTNVVRHAGTDSCRVSVEHRDAELAIEVVDSGSGRVGTEGVGYGLLGLRERVALLHGDFSAGPVRGGGFRVAARLPIPAGVG